MLEDLNSYIQSNPDSRELKRAVAVQMFLKGFKHREIGESLGVSSGFISKWTQRYEQSGVSGLKLGYSGSNGYLAPEQRQDVIAWLKLKNYWNLTELQQHIEQKYEVVFNSKQSYYTLFEQAGISWKKTQKRNPKADPELVEKKQQIRAWLEAHRHEIGCRKLVVLFSDECHLLWGDVCGYVWGKTDERIEVPMTNERSKQTYYGAVDLYTQQCLIQAVEKGNSENTIAFLKYLLNQYPDSRIALIWDGATYHRSQKVKDYLKSVNQGLDEPHWKLTCIRFAPNDPRQNPIEDIWLQAKRFIREYYHLCTSFNVAKFLFEFATHRQIFDFSKLFTYGCFS
uniref:IS630 family transposase n=4 Tax=Desertifilum tharense IPPAS B-1220 TaxID=1781255 RepID=A0ACD5GQH6_9CYAN